MAITRYTITTANAVHHVQVTHNKTIILIRVPPAIVHAKRTYCFCEQDHYDHTMTLRCQGPNGKNKGCPFSGFFHKEHAAYEHKQLGTLRAFGIRMRDNMSFCSACRDAYDAKTEELKEELKGVGWKVDKYRRCLETVGLRDWDVEVKEEGEDEGYYGGSERSSEEDLEGDSEWDSEGDLDEDSKGDSEGTLDSEGTMEAENVLEPKRFVHVGVL
ncbi:uncharacterized protein BDZ99DRAFT_481491 [Mytilinidion resinicola]|uniref:Uncharacterized protein n=1 Tax=Mytilinidion resinicola TaxID=574789 RepID=A0A6A6Y6Y7_9PEZI|nr:uncharacterized protein BDZ99DRAFT_481491 [Mytilinidion resinicola]KAF2804359.1 hypothetical protein BDZ99DRAFT_481491 [Mytilinidion resinicola]